MRGQASESQLSREKSGGNASGYRGNGQHALRRAVIFCIQAENRPHEKGKPDQGHPHDKEAGARGQKQQLQDIRPLLGDKCDAGQEIIFYRGKDVLTAIYGIGAVR